MVEAFVIGSAACGALAGVGYGIAAVIRESYRGRVALLRAKRGDPELPLERATLSGLLLRRGAFDGDV